MISGKISTEQAIIFAHKYAKQVCKNYSVINEFKVINKKFKKFSIDSYSDRKFHTIYVPGSPKSVELYIECHKENE